MKKNYIVWLLLLFFAHACWARLWDGWNDLTTFCFRK